jgi:hypothetical protein
MRPNPLSYVTLSLTLLVSSIASAQIKKKIREYERTFQFSLFPGISTNGISSGSYYNSFSLNLFGGLSAGNRILEIGVITNATMKSSTGLHFAGLANIFGTNAFINLTQSEERTLIIKEDFEVNSRGVMVAGFLNYILNNASGILVSGGANVVGDDFKGLQVAGLGNSAGGTMAGFQLAGLYNLSEESVGGFQISALFNYTNEQLSGVQISVINKARTIKGGKSSPPTRARGLQIGLVNFSKAMDGVQIGLINFGGDVRGKQIGLLNFFHKLPLKEYGRMGTPIGLLNYGSKGSTLRLSYNEVFPTNLEYTTGNCLNCSWVLSSEMPFYDAYQKFNQNVLILGFDPFLQTWGFGYGFQKMLYNKFSVKPSPLNARRVFNYGVKFLHLNRTTKLDRSFNLLSRLNMEYGKRRGPFYVYLGLSLNYFVYEEDDESVYKVSSVKFSSGKIAGQSSECWPGYTVGIQFMTRR